MTHPTGRQPVINYCLKNLATPQTRTLYRNSGFCVVEDFCLQRCGQCYAGPFLVIDGKEVTGESHQVLIEQLQRAVQTAKSQE